jgi:hypothetical protein
VPKVVSAYLVCLFCLFEPVTTQAVNVPLPEAGTPNARIVYRACFALDSIAFAQPVGCQSTGSSHCLSQYLHGSHPCTSLGRIELRAPLTRITATL